jgi:hypothetical protein
MKILAAVQGEYGRRIVQHISGRSPEDWEITAVSLPRTLPVLIDEPEDFLPSQVPPAELLLALIESDGAAQLISALAKHAGVSAAIIPVDDPAWLPMGLQNQVEQELERDGIAAVFPRPFCSLSETGYGFRWKAALYTGELISRFARHFGRPKLALKSEGGIITEVVVGRGSPCGSTCHAAEKLTGTPADEAVPRAGLIVHQYPCLASMQSEEIDPGVYEPFMNISGYLMNEEVGRALKASE